VTHSVNTFRKSNTPNVHCDLYLTWNDLHRDELIKQKFVSKPEKVITTGVPRFDFYKQPCLLLIRERTKNHWHRY